MSTAASSTAVSTTTAMIRSTSRACAASGSPAPMAGMAASPGCGISPAMSSSTSSVGRSRARHGGCTGHVHVPVRLRPAEILNFDGTLNGLAPRAVVTRGGVVHYGVPADEPHPVRVATSGSPVHRRQRHNIGSVAAGYDAGPAAPSRRLPCSGALHAPYFHDGCSRPWPSGRLVRPALRLGLSDGDEARPHGILEAVGAATTLRGFDSERTPSGWPGGGAGPRSRAHSGTLLPARDELPRRPDDPDRGAPTWRPMPAR